MSECKPIGYPINHNSKLLLGQREPLTNPEKYRRLIGKLNYFTITRPDIFFFVNVVSHFLQFPCDSHWNTVVQILRYVKGASDKGLLYENRGLTQIVRYTDVDWADAPSDRRFTSGFYVFAGGSLVS